MKDRSRAPSSHGEGLAEDALQNKLTHELKNIIQSMETVGAWKLQIPGRILVSDDKQRSVRRIRDSCLCNAVQDNHGILCQNHHLCLYCVVQARTQKSANETLSCTSSDDMWRHNGTQCTRGLRALEAYVWWLRRRLKNYGRMTLIWHQLWWLHVIDPAHMYIWCEWLIRACRILALRAWWLIGRFSWNVFE